VSVRSYIQLHNPILLVQAIVDRFSRNSNKCGMKLVPVITWFFEIRAINKTTETTFCRRDSTDKSF
jgi:hypothetical protein